MKETRIVVKGAVVHRVDFDDPEALIGWFLDNLFGRPGIASKVVGATLLWWEK